MPYPDKVKCSCKTCGKGFFPDSDLLSRKVSLDLIPKCGACGLFKKCKSPKMPYSGSGLRKILIVGEAPGKQEDEQGMPFVGASGRLLSENLSRIGIEMRRDCWITNSAACRPPSNELPKNTIEYCRPILLQTIEELQPHVIILLGKSPVQSLIGWAWKEDVGGIGRWVGWKIPNRRLNAWICPTWHPAYLLREREERNYEVLERRFREHLRSACDLEGRPYPKGPPDLAGCIRRIMDVSLVPDALGRLGRASRSPVAFDYETSMLKPDSEDARIISCAVSNGEVSIAYPWQGEAIEATSMLLRDGSIPKIGYNAKFEERWTRRILGHGVENWLWDGLLSAHVLDNRPDICSLKFQAHVLLGVDAYDELKPYMQSDGSNKPNRLHTVGLDRLLKYNALDALYEWMVADVQMKQMGAKI